MQQPNDSQTGEPPEARKIGAQSRAECPSLMEAEGRSSSLPQERPLIAQEDAETAPEPSELTFWPTLPTRPRLPLSLNPDLPGQYGEGVQSGSQFQVETEQETVWEERTKQLQDLDVDEEADRLQLAQVLGETDCSTLSQFQQQSQTGLDFLPEPEQQQLLTRTANVCSRCSKSTNRYLPQTAEYVNVGDFRNTRFLCRGCLTKADKFVLALQPERPQPDTVSNFMRRAMINRHHPQANQIYDRLNQIFTSEVDPPLKELITLQNETMRRIKLDLTQQFLGISSTFRPDLVQSFLKMLQQPASSEQELQVSANAILFAGCRDFSYTDQLMETAKICFYHIGQFIGKEVLEWRKRFDLLEKNFQKYRIGRVYDDKRSAVKNFMEKDKLLKRQMKRQGPPPTINLDSEDPAPPPAPPPPSASQISGGVATVSATVGSAMASSGVGLAQGSTLGLPAASTVSGGSASLPPPSSQSVPPSILKTSRSANPSRPGVKVTFNLGQQQPGPFRLQPKLLLPSKPALYTVEVTADNNEQVWLKESSNNHEVRRVIIFYQRCPERALKGLVSFGQLEELVLFDPKMATGDMIVFYLEMLPKLARLELNCHNDLDGPRAQKLARLPTVSRLQSLFIGPNYHGNLARIDERRWFPEDNWPPRSRALQNEFTEMVLDSCPQLQNVWIDYPTPDLATRLLALKELRFLALGRQDSESQNIRLERRTWQMLSQLSGLVSLSFNKIEVQSEHLEQIMVRSRDTLQTVCLYDCRRLKDHTLTVMQENLAQLRELMFFRIGEGQFNGEDIWKMQSLETLILRECEKFNTVWAEQNARNLINLRHVNLMGCLWVTDDLVGRIAALPSLLSANFGNTNISGHAVGFLKAAQHLRALHIGGTKIRGIAINQLVGELKQLRKLSLKGLGAQDSPAGRGALNSRQMQQICQRLPNLTHLDISGCQSLDDSIFDSVSRSLRFLTLWMATNISKGKRTDLARKGVVIVDDIYDKTH